jgi:hypothetical protein
MTPEELTCRLNNLYSAADIVEAIDNPALQQLRGWNLSQWRYDLIPWGVRFTYLDPLSRCKAEVTAQVAQDPSPDVSFLCHPRTSAGAIPPTGDPLR